MRIMIPWILSALLIANAFAADALVVQQGIRIEVISGERSVNSVTSKANVIPPMVRVKTAGGAPLSGVRVRFELLGNLQRGLFHGEESSIETETNARGEATAPGYLPNTTGAFVIRATAVRNSDQASVDIHQRNHARPYSIYRDDKSSKAIWVLAGAGVAGVVTGLIVSSQGSTSSATINIGSPTVGAPR